MSKILVIVDNSIPVQPGYIEAQIKDEVKLNSVTQDGISIFQCGKTMPMDDDWDLVIKVGECNQDFDQQVNVEIPNSGDPIGDLISAIMTKKEGQVEEAAISE